MWLWLEIACAVLAAVNMAPRKVSEKTRPEAVTSGLSSLVSIGPARTHPKSAKKSAHLSHPKKTRLRCSHFSGCAGGFCFQRDTASTASVAYVSVLSWSAKRNHVVIGALYVFVVRSLWSHFAVAGGSGSCSVGVATASTASFTQLLGMYSGTHLSWHHALV